MTAIARPLQRVPARVGRDLALVVLGVSLLWLGVQAWVIAHNPDLQSHVGNDYRLYTGAAREFLAGHGFYPGFELAGTFTPDAQPVLYPPQMLALFVPFTVLPAALWYIVPLGITVAVIVSHRPALWAWAAIAAIMAWSAWSFTIYAFGTPTIWLVAALALGTRWPAFAACVLVKPTLIPFALLGVRSRSWWLAVGTGLLSAVLLAPMMADWLRVLLNLRGTSPLVYSLGDWPVMAVPVVAWLGRQPNPMTVKSKFESLV